MRSLLSTEVRREKGGKEHQNSWPNLAPQEGKDLKLDSLSGVGVRGAESSGKRAPGSTPISPRCTSSRIHNPGEKATEDGRRD
jgi:hypothetical protein